MFSNFWKTLVVLLASLKAGGNAFKYCRLKTKFKSDCSYIGHKSIPGYLPNTTTVLIMSHNKVSQENGGLNNLSYYPSIKQIFFNDNVFKRIPGEALSRVKNLSWVDFNNNYIKNLESGDFVALQNSQLRNLYLKHNNLTHIKKETFMYLTKLEELDLSDNEIAHVDMSAFKGLKSLKKLRLDKNQLTTIPFQYLYDIPLKLEYLYLNENNILSADLSFLCHLTDFFTFELSDNRMLASLQATNISLCSNTKRGWLNKFILRDTNIIKIDDNVFNLFTFFNQTHMFSISQNFLINCMEYNLNINFTGVSMTNLQLTLSSSISNYHKLIEQLGFCEMNTLKDLQIRFQNIGHNNVFLDFGCLNQLETLYVKLYDIPSCANGDLFLNFSDLNKLINLEISTFYDQLVPNKKFQNLTLTTFSGLNSLKKLRLDKNWITYLPKRVFSFLSNLERLYVAYNDISFIEKGVFSGLSKLETLSLRENHITYLEEGVFSDLNNLKQLNLSDNFLLHLSNSFFGLSNLRELLVAHNNVKTLSTSSDNLTSLVNSTLIDFSNNNLVYLDPNIFSHLYTLNILNISINSFLQTDLYIYDEMFMQLINHSYFKQLDVQNSKLHSFPCYIASSSLKYLSLSKNLLLDKFVLNSSTYLPQFESLDLSFNQITTLEVAAHLPSLQNLYIFYNSISNYNSLKFQKAIVPKIKLLDLSNNNFYVIDSSLEITKVLSTFKNLTKLIINNNRAKHGTSLHSIFEVLPFLVDLFASNCGITILQESFFENLTKLETIDVSNNQIAFLDTNVFWGKISLKNVYLQKNQIARIDANAFFNLTKLKVLYLGMNPLDCTCDIWDFQSWMQTIKYNISFTEDGSIWDSYICSSPQEYIAQSLLLINFSSSCTMDILIIIYVTLGGTVFLVILVILTHHNYWLLRYKFYLCTNHFKRYQPLDDCNEDLLEFEYDLFVSYNGQDIDWVRNQLLLHLEPEFKVCIHDRDFLPGEAITDNIENAFKKSRKSLFVITNSFVESDWCQFEVQFALQMLFKTHKDTMIFVMLEKVPKGKMTSLLKMLISTKTYIEWPENERDRELFFWNKLKVAVANVATINY